MKSLLFTATFALACATSSQAQVFLNELLFNPPGTDGPNEYFEIRGAAGASLSGIYLVGVEGDSGGGPGDIQSIFNLTSQSLGANGFLALGQKNTPYTFNAAATSLVNSGSGAGWGNGASSSVGFSADGTGTDFENTSLTFMLVKIGTGSAPSLALDLDSDNNGTLDAMPAEWTILDSIGILDGGATDIAYGMFNFSQNGAGITPNNPVNLTFTPDYVGRIGNSTGSTPSDWIGAELAGTVPNWTIGNSSDPVFTGFAVDTFGSPNPVPEPHEYALVAGLGLLGFALWRRRSATAALSA